MREKVRAGHYVVTLHAHREMVDDDLSTDDLERAVITIYAL
jgi:hypothetical protein